MRQNETVPKVIRKISYIGAVIIIAVVYNNCGSSPFLAERAYVPVQKLQEDMIATYGGHVAPSTCADSAQYFCTHKIFSKSVSDVKAEIQYGCFTIPGGPSLCVHGEQFQYNSSAAASQCKENCNDDYEFEEFNCYYNLANQNGSYPMQATKRTFEAALTETYNLCLRLTYEK